MDFALGVDVGGTKVSVTFGNSRGQILAKEVLPTQRGRKTREGIQEIVETLTRLRPARKQSAKVHGIGVGIAGPMDPGKGTVERSPHLKGWEGFPLKSFLAKKFRLPVFITNDANAAAVGEKVFGQGRGVRNFVYLTVSTGIGGGIVLNDKLLLGASFGAGEVGHTIVVPEGEKCGCGHRGCLEAYASGTAIARFFKKEFSRGRRSKIEKRADSKKGITAETIALAAEARDVLALEAFRRAGHFLGIGLANLINVVNPELIILGGSVTKSSRFFWPSMMQSVKKYAWPTLYSACRIVKTRFGNEIGDLGALALVFAKGSFKL